MSSLPLCVISSWRLTVVIYPSTQLMEWMIKWETGPDEIAVSVFKVFVLQTWGPRLNSKTHVTKKAHSFMSRDNWSWRVTNKTGHEVGREIFLEDSMGIGGKEWRLDVIKINCVHVWKFWINKINKWKPTYL